MGYAQILKDNMGKPSGYRECDGKVVYLPEQESYQNIFKKTNIDPYKMEVLNHDFIKDDQRVYRKGVLLRGIDPEGFCVLDSIYIGNRQVIYTPYGDAKVAHPETFEVLDDGTGPLGSKGYGRDEEFVYYFTHSTETRHAIRLKGCKNPAAFSILSENYTKDDQHVYLWNTIIKKADPETFSLLGGYYACDDKHIFWRDKVLHADKASFRVLEADYAKDRYAYFFQDTIEKKK